MELLTNEVLLYAGLSVAAAAVLAAVVLVFVLRLKRRRLNAVFDIEYGKKRR